MEWTSSDLDVTKQMRHRGDPHLQCAWDAIVMVGCDNDSSASVVEACNAAGVDHLLVASEATTGTYKFTGFNEYDCGYHQAKYVVVQRGAGREGVRSGGRRRPLPTMSAARLGRAGKCPTWSTHLETGEFTAEKAMQLTDDWCRPIPRIQ